MLLATASRRRPISCFSLHGTSLRTLHGCTPWVRGHSAAGHLRGGDGRQALSLVTSQSASFSGISMRTHSSDT